MPPELAEHRYQACAPVRPPLRGPDDFNRPVFYIHRLPSSSAQAQDAVLGVAVLARLQRLSSPYMAALIKQLGIRTTSPVFQDTCLGNFSVQAGQQTGQPTCISSHSPLWNRTQAGWDDSSAHRLDASALPNALLGFGRLIHERDGEKDA